MNEPPNLNCTSEPILSQILNKLLLISVVKVFWNATDLKRENPILDLSPLIEFPTLFTTVGCTRQREKLTFYAVYGRFFNDYDQRRFKC